MKQAFAYAAAKGKETAAKGKETAAKGKETAAKGKETAAKGGSTLTQSGQATGAFELTSADAKEVVRLMVAGGLVSRVGNDLAWSELKLPENGSLDDASG